MKETSANGQRSARMHYLACSEIEKPHTNDDIDRRRITSFRWKVTATWTTATTTTTTKIKTNNVKHDQPVQIEFENISQLSCGGNRAQTMYVFRVTVLLLRNISARERRKVKRMHCYRMPTTATASNCRIVRSP